MSDLEVELDQRLASRRPRFDAIQFSLEKHWEKHGRDPLAVGATAPFMQELAVELMAPFSVGGYDIVTMGGIPDRVPSSVQSPISGAYVPLKVGAGSDPLHYWLED